MTSHASTYPLEDLVTIGCATLEKEFQKRVESIVRKEDWNFWNADGFPNLVRKCNDFNANCIVVDQASIKIPETSDKPDERVLVALPPAIVVVDKGDVHAATRATRAGAMNVVENTIKPMDLVNNIRIAVELDQRYRQAGVDARFRHSRFSELSDREKMILGLLVDGMKNSAVAARLDISLRTVEAKRAQILKKLDVSSFVQMIRLVAQLEYEMRIQRGKEFDQLFSAAKSTVID